MTKFVSAILVVVVLISAVGAYGVSEARSTVAADTQEHLEATAQHQANSVGAWIRTKKLQTRIASERESIGGDPTNVKTDFQGLIRQYGGGVVAIHYVDTKRGTVTTSTGQLTNRSLDEIDAPWVDAIRSEKMGSPREVWMSDVAYQGLEVTDKVVAFVSIDFSRRYAIVLVARYEVKMQQMNEASKNQTTNILNSNAEPVLADASWGTPGDAELRQSISKRADENTAFIKGDERVYAFTKVPGTDMVTVTSKPTSDAFQVARTVSDLVIWIVGISLFGLIVVGVVLGRHTAVPLVALRNKVHRMEEGDLSVELSTGRIDEIGQLYLGFANMRDSLRDQIQTAQEARAEAQAAQAETEEMNRHLEEKAREYRNVMTAVGEGDLTRRMDPESRNEAMEDIATSFNEMIASLERTTHELSQFAVDVAAGGEEVMASTEEIKSASERVTESVQEISAGAGTQHEKLRAVFEETNELSTTIEEVASSANQVASLSEQTAETGADARKAAEAAVSEMQEIEHEADETVAAIERLQDQMEQIEEITEFITQVAEQTNILALNANIEAARAGDAGEGFAVVAEEVKSLAEETQQAAEEIEQLVDDIQAYTETTAEEVEETSDVVERSTESVQRVIDALEEIAGYAEETNTGVQEISTATEQQASSTNEVVGMVEAATEISETTDAESENVAAAAEEQTSSLSEVAESVNDLAQQADELSDALGRFDTRPEPEGGKPGDVTTTDGRSIDDRTDDDRTSGQDLDEQADVGTEAHPNND